MEYSSTQGNNLLIFAGLIVFVLGKFNVTVAQTDVAEILAAAVSFYGLCANWIKRYKQGGVTLGGFKKS